MPLIEFNYNTIRALRLLPSNPRQTYTQKGVVGLQLIIAWKKNAERIDNIKRVDAGDYYTYTWRFRYKDVETEKRTSIDVGIWPAISAMDAVSICKGLHLQNSMGVSPKAEVLSNRSSQIRDTSLEFKLTPVAFRVDEVVKRFAEYWPSTGKDVGTLNKYRSTLELHFFPIAGSRDIRTITAIEWDSWVNNLANVAGKKGAAANLHKAGRRLFSFAAEQGIIKYNPLLQRRSVLESVRIEPDKRFLDSEQIHDFVNNVDDLKIAEWARVTLKMILMVGVRIEEWQRVKIGWINFKNKKIDHPGEAMKNGKIAATPLTDDAIDLLIDWLKVIKGKYGTIDKDWYLFTNQEDMLKPCSFATIDEVRKDRPFEGFTIKTLRKTISTQLQRQGCPPAVLRAIRNQTITTGVEANYDFDDLYHLKKEWIEKWGEMLRAVKSDPRALYTDRDSHLDSDKASVVDDLFS